MTIPPVQTASIDGLGKNGDLYTFLICIPEALRDEISPGNYLFVEGLHVLLKNYDGEHASFELPLEIVAESALAEVTVGTEVIISKASSAV